MTNVMTNKVADWFSFYGQGRWYQHPLVLGGAPLLALVIIASGVYSIASQATSVAKSAEATNALAETLRVTSAIRSDLSTIKVLDTIPSEEFDTTDARSALLDSVERNGSALQQIHERFPFADVDANVATTFDDFMVSLAGVTKSEASAASVQGLAAAHTSLESAIVVRRDGLLDLLRENAKLMSRTGSMTGYVVAFIVPALALYVLEALRRVRLRSKLTEEANSGLQNRAQISATYDAHDLAMLEEHSAALVAASRFDNPQLRSHLDGIRRSAAALRTRAIARGAALTTSLQPLDLDETLRQILNEAGLNDLEYVSSLAGEVALADQSNFRFALRAILANALEHGAAPIRMKAYPWDDTLTITVSDGGPGLKPEIHRAVFRADLRELRQEMTAGGDASGLVAVRSLIEAMGGSFEYEREGDRSFFVVRLLPSDVNQGSLQSALD